MNLNSLDVLSVDDNACYAKLTIRALKKHTHVKNIVQIKVGEEALDFIFATGKSAGSSLYQHTPKVVLLDINMPKVSGIEVPQKIKTDSGSRSLPVVILTSSDENPDVQKCYVLGANSYIVKPVNSEDFTEAIKNLGLYWKLLNQLI